MSKKDVTSVRSTIEWLRGEGELVVTNKEVDPELEIAGIVKAMDNGPALLFENIKGYPGIRNIANIFAREERVAKMFGVDDWRKLKFKVLDGIRNPIAPKIVDNAPCQEVVVEAEEIDMPNMLPICKHTERDGTRVMGCGIQLMMGEYFRGGSHVSFNRQAWRKDWCTMALGQFTHLGGTVYKTHKGQDIPITININPPPAVLLVAGEGGVRTIIIPGDDELGIAGALQDQPVEIVKAKTVNAYACAQSEWVIEGYITPEREWETPEAEACGGVDITPFFPEWPRYLGKTWKVPKFKATCITHRKDPIFHTPLADSFEGDLGFPLREATFFELADRIAPGFVTDVSILHPLTWWGGVVFQCRKQGPSDEGIQRNILMAAMGDAPSLRLAVAVDEDVNIYSADDVLWAITTRCSPDSGGILQGWSGSRGIPAMPSEKKISGVGGFEGGIALDCTAPWNERWRYERPHHPSDMVDLKRWFTDQEITRCKDQQCDYAKVLAEHGW